MGIGPRRYELAGVARVRCKPVRLVLHGVPWQGFGRMHDADRELWRSLVHQIQVGREPLIVGGDEGGSGIAAWVFGPQCLERPIIDFPWLEPHHGVVLTLSGGWLRGFMLCELRGREGHVPLPLNTYQHPLA